MNMNIIIVELDLFFTVFSIKFIRIVNFGVNCSHRLTIFPLPGSYPSTLSISSLFSLVCSPILTCLLQRPDTSLVLTVWQDTFSFLHQLIVGITQDTSIFILLFAFSAVSAALFSWRHRIIWGYWWECCE